MAQTVNNLLVMKETRVQFLGGKIPLEKGMAILAWTEELCGLQSMGSQKLVVTATYMTAQEDVNKETHHSMSTKFL